MFGENEYLLTASISLGIKTIDSNVKSSVDSLKENFMKLE